jgi:hypothetical protein
MVRKHATFAFLLLFSLNSFAELEAPMKFTGQNAETVKLEKILKVTRSVPREVPGTCERQVPYQEYRCHDVTRYRQECHQVPADQECHTEYDRQCHSVTRYREECTRGPSHQECHTIPTRQVCHERPSHQVCHDRPSREVCHDRPTRQVCTTTPSGQQHCTTVGGGQSCTSVGGGQECTTVGGGQECTTVGGGQECHSEPGEQICRQVPYTDQECRDVPRQACTTIPAHNECNQIPYSEEVCGNETAYRTESYDCMQTVYSDEEVEKKVSAVVNVSFKTNGLVEEFGALVSIAPDAKGENFIPSMKLTTEPKILVIVKKKEASIRAEGEKEIKVEGNIEVELMEKVPGQEIQFPAIESSTLEKKSSVLSVIFAKGLPALEGMLEFEMTYKNKPVAELKDSFPGQKVQVRKVDLKDALILNLKDLITGSIGGGLFSSSPMMKLKLILPSKIEGEILNVNKPKTEKIYEKIKVKRK